MQKQRPHSKKRHRATVARRLPTAKVVWKGFDNTGDIDIILEKRNLFQDILGISSDSMGKMFSQAVGFLNQHRYDEAARAFELLHSLNPFIPDFWIGAGLAHQAHGVNDVALSDFMMAMTIDPKSPDPYRFAVECCLDMQDLPQAIAFVTQAIAYAKKHARAAWAQELCKAAEALLEHITWEKEHAHNVM